MGSAIIYLGFAVVLVATAIERTSGDENEQSIRAKCIAQSGTTEDVIAEATAGAIPEDHPFKCYLKCVFDSFRDVHGDHDLFESMLHLVPSAGKPSDVAAALNCPGTRR